MASRLASIVKVIVSLFLATSILSALPSTGVLNNIVPQVAGVGGLPLLGIDCGLGTIEGIDITGDGVPDGDGTPDTSCAWIGDVDGDGVKDPLVSDIPVFFPPGTGAGFTAEVRVGNLVNAATGFDVTLVYDTNILEAVIIDQRGLPFGDNPPPGSGGVFTVARIIDKTAGRVQLAQAILSGSAQPDANGGLTLFRVRFDVVGAGTGSLLIPNHAITNPGEPSCTGGCPHKAQDGSFESSTAFDPSLQGLNWRVNWTFSPSAPLPGQALSLTATASCPGCRPAASLTYAWDTDSDGTNEQPPSTSPVVTITPPPPATHRVTLTVSNGTASATAVRRIPLAVVLNGSSEVGVNTPGTWDAVWLGGIPNYTADWRFCPGAGPTANAICARPNPINSTVTGQTASQRLDAASAPLGAYHFTGVYNVTVKVTETTPQWMLPQGVTTGITQTAFKLVNVTGSPQAYTVSLTSNKPETNVGDPIALTVSIAYHTSYPSSFRASGFKLSLDYGDGTSSTSSLSGCSTTEPPSSSCRISINRTFNSSGTFNVRVTAQENAPAAVSKIRETTVMTLDVNPTLTADIASVSASPKAGQAVSFTATASGGGAPYTFNWDFGDGTTGSGGTVTHAYSSPGNYTVTLTVTDGTGASETSTRTVLVEAAPPPTIPPELVYAGVAGGIIAAAAGAWLLSRRRRRTTQKMPGSNSPAR